MRLKHLITILSAAAMAAAGPIYTITDLGSLGGSAAQAFGLSANGLTAGSATTTFGYTHAFSSSGSGMNDLTLNSTASEGVGSGVNSSGSVAGTSFLKGQAYATEWTNGFAQTLAGPGSYALAINDAGQTTGMITTSDGAGHAFIGSNGSVTDLGALAGGNWTSAFAINSLGEVAGYGQTSPGISRAFIWSEATGYVVLGTLGGTNSYAMAMNDSGQVAGNAQTGAGYAHAFVSKNGSMQDLGTLGGTSSYAYGINNAGGVVGYSYVNGASRAFLFADGLILDLNNLIDPSSGWVLTAAYAINGTGQIAGTGLVNGVEHAFRLDYASGLYDAGGSMPSSSVPEPATLAIAAIGLVGLAWRARRVRPCGA